ncbi:chloride channel protein [Paenibacillus assamensis]|uniref:chloride channel protein n=1 Tax=Paenibacillus assamensis TaxID=311244 RepID=UPI0003F54D92|nr:chloride channel protein [Paenibacillus assamensis]
MWKRIASVRGRAAKAAEEAEKVTEVYRSNSIGTRIAFTVEHRRKVGTYKTMRFLGMGNLFIYSIIIGGITGVLTWSFLAVVSFTTHLIWTDIPNMLNMKFWTVLVCLVGGILVGLCQKYFGNYPRTMDAVLAEFKSTNRIDYRSLYKSVITAICVLSFGASLGPEAALVGIVGGLATWAGEAIKSFVKKRTVLNEHGEFVIEYSVEAAVGMIFRAPLFGAYTLLEDSKDSKRVKWMKTLVYVVTTIAGFFVFMLLSKIDNRQLSLADFGPAAVGMNELMATIPLILVGVLLAKVYKYFGHILHKGLKPLEHYKVIKAVIGGLILGTIGTLLPLTLFSGEHQLNILAAEWTQMSAYLLIGIGIAKLFVTEACLVSGWRGGHIFPIIFAGVSIGYGIAMLFPLDPVTSITIVTTALTSAVLKKPIAVILLFMLLFPLKLILLMVAAAYLPKYMAKLTWNKSEAS